MPSLKISVLGLCGLLHRTVKMIFVTVSIHIGIGIKLTIRLNKAKWALKHVFPSQRKGAQSKSGKLQSTTKFSTKKKEMSIYIKQPILVI